MLQRNVLPSIAMSLGLFVLAVGHPVIFPMSSFTHIWFLHKAMCRLCDVADVDGILVFLQNMQGVDTPKLGKVY